MLRVVLLSEETSSNGQLSSSARVLSIILLMGKTLAHSLLLPETYNRQRLDLSAITKIYYMFINVLTFLSFRLL